MDQPVSSSTHVLMFPLPAQGDLKPMLELAELLCLADLKVTFLNTTFNHQRMTQYADIETHFSRYPGFRFETIPDGLPDDHPRAGGNWLLQLLQGLKSNVTPFLRKKLPGTDNASRVTCLIVDTLLNFAYEIANEVGVPVIDFKASSACFLWTYHCLPMLVEAGQIPFNADSEEDMDDLVQNVPGISGLLRHRDLPSFYRIKDLSNPDIQFLLKSLRTREARPIILNTFEDLEGPITSHLQAYYPRIYSVGPLQAHLKHRLSLQETTSSSCSTSLWEMDRSCLSWLDQKPDNSVIYVSFGSLATLTTDKFMEIWAGLVQSNTHFLWVVRPNMITGSNPDSPNLNELLKETEGRGCVVDWAPQEEVLAHRAVGGFLTHSGWNSTLESIITRVPMLCWPYFADQQVNSRYVSEVWKIGLDMKDTCDRTTVEKMVRDLMHGKRNELESSMAKMSELANRSITEGGTSHSDLGHLIEDIKAMSKKVVH